MTISVVALGGLALVLGFRHGIDWDHVAAITDLIAGGTHRLRGLFFAMLYALGHGTVVLLLGIPVIVADVHVPGWLGRVMEPVVGATLIALGGWVLVMLFTGRHELAVRSRWMLLYQGVRRGWRRLWRKDSGGADAELGAGGAFTVGVIHGAGAETPTQLMVFAAAMQAGGRTAALGVFFLFVAGMLVANLLISLLTMMGYGLAGRRMGWRVVLAGCTSVYSVVVGIVFLIGQAVGLPSLAGP
ncbi:MAG TPA: hypothetical protein GX517_12005 [Alicyclobacillus sp.]|nr:hypothetical protein [Alicyclobacillus sp.]